LIAYEPLKYSSNWRFDIFATLILWSKDLAVSGDPAEFGELKSLASRNLEVANFAARGGGTHKNNDGIYALRDYQYRPTVGRFRAPTFGLASLTLFGNPLRECRSRFATSRPMAEVGL